MDQLPVFTFDPIVMIFASIFGLFLTFNLYNTMGLSFASRQSYCSIDSDVHSIRSQAKVSLGIDCYSPLETFTYS